MRKKDHIPVPALKHQHIIKLGRIMDMLYKPSEIAEEIGVSVDTVYRSYMPAGCPYIEDEHKRYWIHGPAFVAWARQTISQRKRNRYPLAENQAWCMKCNRPVEMKRARPVHQNRYMVILQSTCPHCRTKVNRTARRAP